jgi:enoyl-CoA hydratase/carnithine racemase
MAQGLTVTKDGAALVVEIDHGEDNLFSGEMIDSLAESVQQAGEVSGLRFVRLVGRGPRFCIGRQRAGTTPDELRAEAARIVRANEALRSTPLTTIAQVNGDAAGFGAGLVAACDMAVIAEHAALSFPEILGGLAPTVVISWLAFSLPHKRAFELVATGRKLSADEAVHSGLVTEVVPAADLEPRVDGLIAELSDKHPLALREIKHFFAHVRSLDPRSAAQASIDPLVLSSLRLLP